VLVAIAAVVLAGAAAYLSYEYAHKADTRAQKNIERVDVLVANSDISKGTSAAQALNSGLIGTKAVPRAFLPPTVVANAGDLTDKISVATISKGQFIVGESFVKPAEAGGFSAGIPKGLQAITISVDASHSVGGFVQPGDRVNVLYSGPLTDQKSGVKGSPNPARISAFLLPSVRVLAVGTATANSAPASSTATNAATSGTAAGSQSSAAASTGNAGLITLEVTPRQAVQIAQATSLGIFYLSLDAPGLDPSKFTPPAEIVESWNLFDQHLGVVDELRAAAGK
jgi:pilus assembly protein CpaB